MQLSVKINAYWILSIIINKNMHYDFNKADKIIIWFGIYCCLHNQFQYAELYINKGRLSIQYTFHYIYRPRYVYVGLGDKLLRLKIRNNKYKS